MADDRLPPHDPNPYPYGFCPVCGCHGTTREHAREGNDSCAMGHKYLSRNALKDRPTDLRTLIQHRIERYKATRSSLNLLVDYDTGIASTLEWIVSDLKLCLDDSSGAVPHPSSQSHADRLTALETEVRRLNNAARHMRAKLRAAFNEEGEG